MEAMTNMVLAQMQPVLNYLQLKQLKTVLESTLYSHAESSVPSNSSLLDLFLTAKEVEGCSSRTITYYESTLKHMDSSIGQSYTQICSDDLRKYLSDYESNRNAGKVTIDNIRRIMSSFFSWLEDEGYIVKSPVRRIRKVKTATTAKEVLSDEDLETLRDNCPFLRDLAIVDMKPSTTRYRTASLGPDDASERDKFMLGTSTMRQKATATNMLAGSETAAIASGSTIPSLGSRAASAPMTMAWVR